MKTKLTFKQRCRDFFFMIYWRSLCRSELLKKLNYKLPWNKKHISRWPRPTGGTKRYDCRKKKYYDYAVIDFDKVLEIKEGTDRGLYYEVCGFLWPKLKIGDQLVEKYTYIVFGKKEISDGVFRVVQINWLTHRGEGAFSGTVELSANLEDMIDVPFANQKYPKKSGEERRPLHQQLDVMPVHDKNSSDNKMFGLKS